MDYDYEDALNAYNNRTRSKFKSMPRVLSSLFTGAGGILGTILQNVYNTRQLKETNKANRELVNLQNTAQAQEHEKAYQRSLPTVQIANMRAAGMSEAGAINTLNGGGSYQPAPVNTAQDAAPQIDMSTAINAMQAAAQLNEQKRQFNEQIKLEKRKQNHVEKQWNDMEQHREYTLYELMDKADITHNESVIKRVESAIAKATEQSSIDAINKSNLALSVDSILNTFRSKKVYAAMQRMTDEDIDKLFELQATLNMLQQGLKYDSSQFIMDALKKLGELFAGGKGIGKNIRMH